MNEEVKEQVLTDETVEQAVRKMNREIVIGTEEVKEGEDE
jgi:hypothetical protein